MPTSYQQLLEDKLLYLPIASNERGYKHTLIETLDQFKKKIDAIDDGLVGIEDLPEIDGLCIKSTIGKFISGLNKTIKLYYDGQPAAAYHKFANTVLHPKRDFSKILRIESYAAGTSFFRMRKLPGSIPVDRINMFHIPFEQRGKIATQRYSIPGFPCLYVSRTLYACWEELNRPDLNDFFCVKLKNTKVVKFLDLTPPPPDENIMSKRMYHYLMSWPLIACCSVKVSDYGDAFKAEYIIPQLLLQFVRKNHNFDAIRFNSTHIQHPSTKSEGDFSNLVFPVKSDQSIGHCSKLKDLFEMTESISWPLYQHSGDFNMGFSPDQQRIVRLELIPGKPVSYITTALGKMESLLEQMDTNPL